uniref:Uncharacterized protein n=1 Tax=Myotis myotis TaxID=51298 RepID=A0A7J7RRY7_MYOMY|nr:hypothetical protein mMyoMyo1_010213 [Myotis myotis]
MFCCGMYLGPKQSGLKKGNSPEGELAGTYADHLSAFGPTDLRGERDEDLDKKGTLVVPWDDNPSRACDLSVICGLGEGVHGVCSISRGQQPLIIKRLPAEYGTSVSLSVHALFMSVLGWYMGGKDHPI